MKLNKSDLVNMTDNRQYFYSIARTGEEAKDSVRITEIKIRRSVFICSLAYVSTIEIAKSFISRISKEHKTATHNCWAYILGNNGLTRHCSDAGEPAGTAGQPILNTLTSYCMTWVAAVVSRYFGGVKLGIRGLREAYSQSIETAINAKPLIRLVNTATFKILLTYDFNEIFLNRIKSFFPYLKNTEYTSMVEHIMEVEEKNLNDFEICLSEYARRSLIRFEKLSENFL